MKPVKTMSLILLGVLAIAVLVGCSSSEETTTGEPTPSPTEPDFVGKVVEVYSNGTNDVLGSILVEGTDVIQSSDKYDVTIKTETLMLDESGKNVTFADLETGQLVSIWFSGPIMESYPAQVDAAQVIITGQQSLDLVELGYEFEMKPRDRVEIWDAAIDIVFKGVTGDSRCPQNARCVWQGEVSVEIEIIGGNGTQVITLTQPGLYYDYSKVDYENYEISFKVLPYPESETEITDEEYRLLVMIR